MNRSLPRYLDNPWPTLAQNYELARANMDLANASNVREGYDEILDRHTRAVDAILLTPAECAADIHLKIEVMDREEIDDNWWCLREAVALLAVDAREILPLRAGGEAR